MRIHHKELVAVNNPLFSEEALALREEEELQDLLQVLQRTQQTITDRITLVRRSLKNVHSRNGRGRSAINCLREDALESLDLPRDVEHVLGRRGLGIRTVPQLVRYSRKFLEEQLYWYAMRVTSCDPHSPAAQGNITEDIPRWMDAVEAKLALKERRLAQEGSSPHP